MARVVVLTLWATSAALNDVPGLIPPALESQSEGFCREDGSLALLQEQRGRSPRRVPNSRSGESGAGSGSGPPEPKPKAKPESGNVRDWALPPFVDLFGPAFFGGVAAVTLLLGALLLYCLDHARVAEELSGSITFERWCLILMSCLVQVTSATIYSIGAWQDDLRDALGISVQSTTLIVSVTFVGCLAAPLGGLLYDKLGPRAAVLLGGTLSSVALSLMGLAVVGHGLSSHVKVALTAVGSFTLGYCESSLLDNVVCMACSESFPRNRAGLVGCCRAALAVAAGLWALLWVHVFKKGAGLPAFLALMAVASFLICLVALPGIKVLPPGLPRRHFDFPDLCRLWTLVALLAILAIYNVVGTALSCTDSSDVLAKPMVGYVGGALQFAPLLILLTTPSGNTAEEDQVLKEDSTSPRRGAQGMPFLPALWGLDFWLAWWISVAVFGSAVGTNQNMALILESAGHPAASSMAVALFALTSSLCRVFSGVLSDKYNRLFNRFNWLTLSTACSVLGQLLMSQMSFSSITLGNALMGFAFGIFATVMVPALNEMYGGLDFGKIFGVHLSSQALGSFLISFQLLPDVYSRAAGGHRICRGSVCFRTSFLLLAVSNFLGLLAAVTLQIRNRSSMPRTRLKSDSEEVL